MHELLKRYQTISVIILSLALPIIVLVLSHGDRQKNMIGQTTTGSALAFVQNHNDYLIGNASGLWDTYVDLIHTKRENEELRLENARLREENIGLQGILQQNARLLKLVGFKQERPIYDLEPARVISADISPYFRVLRIRIEAQSEVASRRQYLVVELGGVGPVDEERQRVGSCPGGRTFVAVFDTQFVHAFELAVEAGDFQFEVALVAIERLDVEHRLTDDEVDGRR